MALRLYEWNIAASSALHGTLGQFEVLLRNALDEQLVRYHKTALAGTGQWWSDPAMPIANNLRDQIRTAQSHISQSGSPVTHGKVVAELMFGFWRYLLDTRHSSTLWAQALRHAFPHLRPKVRTEVYDRVTDLHQLRNRVAHHEPVHQLDLDQRWTDLITVAGWICPTTTAWIWSTSTVPAVLASKPE